MDSSRALGASSPLQADHVGAAEIGFDPVVVDAKVQAMADEPARHRVEDVAAHEA